jgi:hypothetical protein
MRRGNPSRIAPAWLSPLWEERRKKTAGHVNSAIGKLVEAGQPVTITSIRNQVHSLFGRALSANTIKRNELAYQTYLAYRVPPKAPQVKSSLMIEFYAQAAPAKRPGLHAKVARFRRQPKDDLIVRLIRLEETVKLQTDVENRLREEIIRTNLRATVLAAVPRVGR